MVKNKTVPQARASEVLRRRWDERSRLGDLMDPWGMFPVDVDDLVHAEGWQIERVAQLPLDVRESGGQAGLVLCRQIHGRAVPATRTIWISIDNQSPQRQRFTAAHELGHAVLHPEVEAFRIRPLRRHFASSALEQTTAAMEQQADAFAASLLMPERAVRDRFHHFFGVPAVWALDVPRYAPEAAARIAKYGADARIEIWKEASRALASVMISGQSLAAFFGVGQEAMGRRLRALRLVRP